MKCFVFQHCYTQNRNTNQCRIINYLQLINLFIYKIFYRYRFVQQKKILCFYINTVREQFIRPNDIENVFYVHVFIQLVMTKRKLLLHIATDCTILGVVISGLRKTVKSKKKFFFISKTVIKAI